ncbi:MAG TPA: hypothetical protein VGA69_06055 [Nitriliruptorales bacterium]
MADRVPELVDTVCNDLVFATDDPCRARDELLRLIGELAVVLRDLLVEIHGGRPTPDVAVAAYRQRLGSVAHGPARPPTHYGR